MILILSDNEDLTTCEVIDWIRYYNQKFIVITPHTPINIIKIDEEDFIINADNNLIHFSDIVSYWYRRGKGMRYNKTTIEYAKDIPLDLSDIFQILIKEETNTLLDYIYYKLSTITHINSLEKSSINKIVALDIARTLGLKTPKTLITSNKNELLKFISDNKSVITKTALPSLLAQSDQYIISAYTERITMNDALRFNEVFFPSFFQEEIQKELELRIFMLNKEFYSMAILSQLDESTALDFRHYNNENPNRTIPFTIPESLKIKLINFSEMIGINCGSFDIIVDQNREYYFLELNPIGQLSMVSHPCNYNIEHKIALFLINGKN